MNIYVHTGSGVNKNVTPATWAQSRESHHHTHAWGVSGHNVGSLGLCGNAFHTCIHSVGLIALSGVSTVYTVQSIISYFYLFSTAAKIR